MVNLLKNRLAGFNSMFPLLNKTVTEMNMLRINKEAPRLLYVFEKGDYWNKSHDNYEGGFEACWYNHTELEEIIFKNESHPFTIAVNRLYDRKGFYGGYRDKAIITK